MSDRYLEVSSRHGKPFAAYLFLPRRPGDHSARTERFSDALVIVYTDDGRAIRIESFSRRWSPRTRSTAPWRTCISRGSRPRISHPCERRERDPLYQ